MFKNLNKFQIILIIFLLLTLFFLGIAMCLKNKLLKENFKSKVDLFVMFHANWCPFCRDSLPEFKKLQKKLQNSKLKIIEIEESHKKNSKIWQKYKNEINGFPTILLVKKNKTIKHYKGNRTLNEFEKFLENN